MEHNLIITGDGSHSVALPSMSVTYHSTHGAIQESQHVFIASGLEYVTANSTAIKNSSVFEMGFGTGLNALLTLVTAEQLQQKIYYETVEAFPLAPDFFSALNYCALLQRPDLVPAFLQMHQCSWNTTVELDPYFSFRKINTPLADHSFEDAPDIIYFDAFAPDIQPDLWTEAIFTKLYRAANTNAVLTTYCSKSIVRKAMAAAGWKVEKIAGPPHKREIVRAIKK